MYFTTTRVKKIVRYTGDFIIYLTPIITHRSDSRVFFIFYGVILAKYSRLLTGINYRK